MKKSLFIYILKTIYQLFLSICLFFVSLYCIVITYIKCTFFYKIFVNNNPDIIKSYLSKKEIFNNYKVMCDYITSFSNKKLILPDFRISKHGLIHFQDVQDLLNFFTYISIICLIFLVINMILIKNDIIKYSNTYIKIFSISSILICILLSILFLTGFTDYFYAFHDILFKNDYWLFNSNTDPVINILPESFFMYSTIIILSALLIESTVLLIITHTYKKIQK